ncbi:(2Fe-2S)-binding protein [Streptomyces roseochromogenus]|uniref:BFD-like [2Fe-2S]-binding domain-containing protein n=1 Tax=Streptomyces roseochromogenus subsp. oscitans DS 12.976 TaxID=1352936 RepID=V6KTJ5_STRRC|nr:(2Fe-2S)-binding protein [Streptomyces roseochromogenus]EST35462.1 hypothetical protein M878_05775 [Streptomyces roseochromogenus subsp. oscitans DS 12.976]
MTALLDPGALACEAGVIPIRTAEDCAGLTPTRALVWGGGALAVEVASALAARGIRTSLVCTQPNPLHDLLGDTASGMLTAHLEQAGITVLGSASPLRYSDGRLSLADGSALSTDVLLLARDTTGPGEPLRLRSAVVDVACLGEPDAAEGPGVRQITLTDPGRNRYARLAVRDDKIVAAVLVGLPQAIATLGLLHRRGQYLPADRLGLLLDLPARPASTDTGSGQLEDTVICLCNNVSRRTLAAAWQAGARTQTALATATRAATGCGGCGPTVQELCGIWAAEPKEGSAA